MLPQVFTLVVLIAAAPATGSDNEFDSKQNADIAYSNYLFNEIDRYGIWIEKNNQDPSTPIPDTFTLQSPNLLKCEIKDQLIRYHSTVDPEFIGAYINFDKHSAMVYREVHHPYELSGHYSCVGVINAYYHDEMMKDLSFSGTGNFIVRVNSSDERLEIRKFGITQDYRFDLSHVESKYLIDVDLAIGSVKLRGWWNDTKTLKYIEIVQEEFRTLYASLIIKNQHQSDANPSGALLVKYVNEILKDTNLTRILDAEHLPQPYAPIGTPRSRSSKTPDATPVVPKSDSNSAGAFSKSGVILVQIFLVTIMVLSKQ